MGLAELFKITLLWGAETFLKFGKLSNGQIFKNPTPLVIDQDYGEGTDQMGGKKQGVGIV